MSHRKGWLSAAILCIAWLVAVAPAWAVIERPLPLKGLVGDSDFVFVGRVSSLDPSRPSMVIEVQSDLKGKAPMRRLAVLLKGEDDSGKQQIVPRLAVGSAVVGFITANDDDNPQTTDPLIALLYFEGTWVQLQGTPAGDSYRWQYTHAEPYLRRTFAGRSSELGELVTEALADKKPWPEVQSSMKPGLGPKIGEEGNPPPTAPLAVTESTPAATGHGEAAEPANTKTLLETHGYLIFAGLLAVVWAVAYLIRTIRHNSSDTPPAGK